MLSIEKIKDGDESYLYSAVKYDFLKIAMTHHGDLAYYSSDVKQLIKDRIENLYETPSFQAIKNDNELYDILEKQKEYFNEEIKNFEFPERRKIVSYLSFENVYEDEEASQKEIKVKRDFVENFLNEKEIQILRSFSYDDFSNYISHNFIYEHMEEYDFNEASSKKINYMVNNQDFSPDRFVKTQLNKFMHSYFNGELIDSSSTKNFLNSFIEDIIDEINDNPPTFNPFLNKEDEIKESRISNFKYSTINNVMQQYKDGEFADHSSVKYIVGNLIKDTVIFIDSINNEPENFFQDKNKNKLKIR